MNRITTSLCTVILVMFAACGVSDPDAAPQETTGTDTSAIEVPAALDAITPFVTCSSQGNVCAGTGTCRAAGGTFTNGTGCATGLICCHVPPAPTCQNQGDVCTGSGTCRAGGGTIVGLPGCASGQICCAI